jgi:hypothetical protein
LIHRQGLLQIKGISPIQEIVQALGEEPILHVPIKEVVQQEQQEAASPLILRGASSAAAIREQQLKYYEPQDCHKIDCPLCNESAALRILQSSSQSQPKAEQLQKLCPDCGGVHS